MQQLAVRLKYYASTSWQPTLLQKVSTCLDIRYQRNENAGGAASWFLGWAKTNCILTAASGAWFTMPATGEFASGTVA